MGTAMAFPVESSLLPRPRLRDLCVVLLIGRALVGCGTRAVCGDGKVEGNELCEPGIGPTEDDCAYGFPTCARCNSRCSGWVAARGGFCGDGLVDPVHEACDDGDTASCTGACDWNCRGPSTPTGCGDGLVCGAEACDSAGDSPTCSSDCVRKRPKVAVGALHSCALLGSGEIRCWGNGEWGQLGNGRIDAEQRPPVTVIGIDGTTASAIDVHCGDQHSCAVLADGSVVCWGSDACGQLGQRPFSGYCEETALATAPVVVTGLADAISVAAGAIHSCAIRGDGSVVCWGSPVLSGASEPNLTATLIDVEGLDGGTGATVAIAAGSTFTCALLATGEVRCWGFNSEGQLGNGTPGELGSSATPVTVTGIDGVADGAVAIAAGTNHACAILRTGEVRCWGENLRHQLGNADPPGNPAREVFPAFESEPVVVLGLGGPVELAASSETTCARLDGNVVKCWGGFFADFFASSVPASLDDGIEDLEFPRVVPVADGESVKVVGIGMGLYHACALLASGQVRCWGLNTSGQVGDGDVIMEDSLHYLQMVDVWGIP